MSNPIESIVTSLHWSQELAKAGWEYGNANFWWCLGFKDEWRLDIEPNHERHVARFPDASFAAPTAEEILRDLDWEQRIEAIDNWCKGKFESLADSAASQWIYCKKINLLPTV